MAKILFLTNNLDISGPVFAWLREKEGASKILLWEQALDIECILDFQTNESFDYIISYNYSHIIPESVCELFIGKIINLHISYLPYNRGASPNLWSFVENTPKGVTIHYIDAGVDTGKIILRKEIDFSNPDDTLRTTYAKLHKEIQELFRRNWDAIKNGSIIPQTQHGEGTYHTRKQTEQLMREYGISLDDTIIRLTTKLAGRGT